MKFYSSNGDYIKNVKIIEHMIAKRVYETCWDGSEIEILPPSNPYPDRQKRCRPRPVEETNTSNNTSNTTNNTSNTNTTNTNITDNSSIMDIQSDNDTYKVDEEEEEEEKEKEKEEENEEEKKEEKKEEEGENNIKTTTCPEVICPEVICPEVICPACPERPEVICPACPVCESCPKGSGLDNTLLILIILLIITYFIQKYKY